MGGLGLVYVFSIFEIAVKISTNVFMKRIKVEGMHFKLMPSLRLMINTVRTQLGIYCIMTQVN